MLAWSVNAGDSPLPGLLLDLLYESEPNVAAADFPWSGAERYHCRRERRLVCLARCTASTRALLAAASIAAVAMARHLGTRTDCTYSGGGAGCREKASACWIPNSVMALCASRLPNSFDAACSRVDRTIVASWAMFLRCSGCGPSTMEVSGLPVFACAVRSKGRLASRASPDTPAHCARAVSTGSGSFPPAGYPDIAS